MRRLVSRVLALFHRRRLDARLDDEVASHLDRLTDDFIRRGLSPATARLAARRAFGAVEPMKESHRDRRAIRWLSDARQDLSLARRALGTAPAYTAVAIVTLALGIGATTALFTITRDVLLRPLPAVDPSGLVELGCVDPGTQRGADGCDTSFAGFEMYRSRRDVTAGVFAFAPIADLTAGERGRSDIVRGMLTSGEMAAVLGMKAHIGRVLTLDDDRPDAPLAAMLSYGYWQTRFGGDARAVGTSISLNGHAAFVVGVAPAAFRGFMLGDVPDVLVPMSSADLFLGSGTLRNGGSWWLRVIVRRRPDITTEQLERALAPTFAQTVQHNLASVPPELASRVRGGMTPLRIRVQPARYGALSELRRTLDRPLRTLMALVGFFQLIACANLAALVGWRALSRQREFNLRLALGATRTRLFRQMLTETLLLAGLGGAAGLLLAQWVAPAVVRLAVGEAGVLALDLRPDAGVLIATAIVSSMTGVLAGAGSVLRVSRANPQDALRAVKVDAYVPRFGRWLLAGQCALTVVLLVGAGLFARTLANLRLVDAGFSAEGRVMADVAPVLAQYDATAAAAYVRRVLAALDAMPEIASATYSADPMGRLGNTTLVDVPGFESAMPDGRMVGRNTVGPRFAETLGLQVRHGRDIAAGDIARSARVALVNESFARHFFGTTDAVGRRFRLLGQEAHEIVGVVADARDRGVRMPAERVVYESPLDHPEDGLTFTVRGGSSAALLPVVQRALAQTDDAVPIRRLRTVEADMDDALRRERLLSILTTSFGGIALFLVALGLYGTLGAIVTRRTAEIGIRMALGSRQERVLWLVTREMLAFVAGGMVAGMAASFALKRLIETQLFGVSAFDPGVAAGAIGLLFAVACAAALLPARRAARIDPATALRCD